VALPRTARLRASAEIRKVLDSGRRRAGRFHALYWLHRDDASGPRAAFVVSRRVGGAVTRNRARRRLSAAVQRRLALLDPGVDLVLVARRGAAECPFAEVDQDVERLLREAGVLRAAAGAGGEDEV